SHRCSFTTWLAHLLVEEHADEKSERVVSEQLVGGGVSGDVKGHRTSLASCRAPTSEKCSNFGAAVRIPSERSAHLRAKRTRNSSSVWLIYPDGCECGGTKGCLACG